jgi:hypothetical protein
MSHTVLVVHADASTTAFWPTSRPPGHRAPTTVGEQDEALTSAPATPA